MLHFENFTVWPDPKFRKNINVRKKSVLKFLIAFINEIHKLRCVELVRLFIIHSKNHGISNDEFQLIYQKQGNVWWIMVLPLYGFF